jgi:predicted glutamine amidotransferase
MESIKMHTYNTKNMSFIHNGDFSGDVLICSNKLDYGISDERDEKFKIPMDELLDFVAEAVRSKKISELESMTAKQLLGITNDGD